MPRSERATVLVLAAPGTLQGVDERLAHAGVRPVRLTSISLRPVPPSKWIDRLLRRQVPDTLLVTSAAAVRFGVLPWRRALGRWPPGLVGWAVGPRTAQELRRSGVRSVRTPTRAGSDQVVRAGARGPPRRILYFRSDRAGPQLATALRARGHTVLEVVAYRHDPSPPLSSRERREVTRAALLVITSPSGIDSLRERLGPTPFGRLARRSRLVVLGAKSARRARARGFRRVSVAPSTEPVRFTRHLLRELTHVTS